jgi:hypothetical protein
MRPGPVLILLLASVLKGDAAVAQAARIGRLPVLAPLRAATTRCRALPIDAALRRDGVASGVMATDSANSRLVTLTLAPDGRAKLLIAMMSDSTGPRRRESETVTVMFGRDGRVSGGKRTAAPIGTPAQRSEDRDGGLLPADTALAEALVGSVRGCGRG